MTMTATMTSNKKHTKGGHQDELYTSGKNYVLYQHCSTPALEIFEHHVRPAQSSLIFASKMPSVYQSHPLPNP